MSVLGVTSPYWASELLGTDYDLFESPTGIRGLAKENGDRLDILAVDTTEEGKGQFRNFIIQCKKEYQEIYVWEVWNLIVEQALERYGFEYVKEFQIDKEVEGLMWKRVLAKG